MSVYNCSPSVGFGRAGKLLNFGVSCRARRIRGIPQLVFLSKCAPFTSSSVQPLSDINHEVLVALVNIWRGIGDLLAEDPLMRKASF